jgi:hypothetical protein
MPKNSPVHTALRKSDVGDEVRLVARGTWIHVESAAGVPIAALSEAGRREWGPRLESIRKATITAMIRRNSEQEDEAFRSRNRVSGWEYPILEVCWDERNVT